MPVLYSFYPNVNPGFKIVQQPNNIIYLPLNADFITGIRIQLTDQNGIPIDLQNEIITLRLQLKYM